MEKRKRKMKEMQKPQKHPHANKTIEVKARTSGGGRWGS